MAETVVTGALVGITQDIVGFRSFFKLGFGLGIIRISVRVIFHQPKTRYTFLITSSEASRATPRTS